MEIETVRVTPAMLPPTISTAPNSPSVWAKLRMAPVAMPGNESGTITRRKVAARDTPRHQEAREGKRQHAAGEFRIERPQRAARADGQQHVEAEHRRRQYQGQRYQRFHQELPSPRGKRQPVGDGQPESQQDRRGGSREPYAEPDCLPVHIPPREKKIRTVLGCAVPPPKAGRRGNREPPRNPSGYCRPAPCADR